MRRYVLIAALIVCIAMASHYAGSMGVAGAQSVITGYSQRPWLASGWHRVDELQSLGVVSGPNDWFSYYGGKFAFAGCGFAISYGVVVGGSGQVQVYLDGQMVDEFNVSTATDRYQSRWYIAPSCGVHQAAFGTNTIRSMWLIGVEVVDNAP